MSRSTKDDPVWGAFEDLKEVMKERKERLGVDCPACKKKLPKAIPKVLLPGQKCWCGYRDPRDNQSHEVWTRADKLEGESND